MPILPPHASLLPPSDEQVRQVNRIFGSALRPDTLVGFLPTATGGAILVLITPSGDSVWVRPERGMLYHKFTPQQVEALVRSGRLRRADELRREGNLCSPG